MVSVLKLLIHIPLEVVPLLLANFPHAQKILSIIHLINSLVELLHLNLPVTFNQSLLLSMPKIGLPIAVESSPTVEPLSTTPSY